MDGARFPGSQLGTPSWSRRYKENLERLRSGDRAQVAEVVRQLSDREAAAGVVAGISAGEGRMLARARRMLDDWGDGPAGVREPRRPVPPDDAVSSAVSESQAMVDRTAERVS